MWTVASTRGIAGGTQSGGLRVPHRPQQQSHVDSNRVIPGLTSSPCPTAEGSLTTSISTLGMAVGAKGTVRTRGQ